ncbi:nuclear transport factor 2 family protein [Actinomadura harenae]|uniref:Ketosteroid isomerase n=1 Tax=Actinomadura harenae TaxID=2483351 RepID=A0A3M2MCG7_9ACTN|nr:nuclear transport factor 2 family protein [Actinomadura harenae]RMI46335.1 ketosteroid isomerase [Actinomadura harenae]
MTTTRTTVEDLLGRIAEGDPAHLAALFADDCDWKLNWPDAEHGRAETPWIRHRTTPAEAAAHFAEIAAHHVPEKNETRIDRILVDGDDAVLLGVIRQVARTTDRPYTSRLALHVTVRDGRITRYHVYEDSLAVAQAFTPGT